MKVGDKEFTVEPAPGLKPATVVLKVKVYGIAVAQELVTPKQAREFAMALMSAADAAEGGSL